MDDRVCLITGATAGLGKATTLELAKLGVAGVVMARDSTKGEMTVAQINNAALTTQR
jgi:NADP-dependent 3-hydroxy acid dehydrogenase YdfG